MQLVTQLNGEASGTAARPVAVVNGVPTDNASGSDKLRALATAITDLANAAR
jgi:hypothetical protein